MKSPSDHLLTLFRSPTYYAFSTINCGLLSVDDLCNSLRIVAHCTSHEMRHVSNKGNLRTDLEMCVTVASNFD